MAIKNARAIDKNFVIEKKVIREGLCYHNAEELDVYGVQRIDGVYRRMPYDIASSVSEQVAAISLECAGGRCRFTTDSPYVAILVKYRSVAKVPNYSHTATLGFDLYAQGDFVGAFVPSLDVIDTFEGVIDVEKEGVNEYTLNFPVCSEIEELYVGVKEGSILQKASKYAIEAPVVLYGSSITQGACASRPGNTYANILSRRLNCNYLNLGFWGNARGEEAMAKYIAGLPMSAFIYDYDHNAPSAAHLEATHENMFKIIREQNPTLPIIIVSAPKPYPNGKDMQRFAVIEKTYQNAVANGDKYTRYLAGPKMIEKVKDIALADSVHPADVGFLCMANAIEETLKEFL